MDELDPVMTVYSHRENCTMKDAQCNGRECSTCGFSVAEVKRRKTLPLVKLDTGLYGKRIGKRSRPED